MNTRLRDVSLTVPGAVDAARLSGAVVTYAQVEFVGVGISSRRSGHGAGCGLSLVEAGRVRRGGPVLSALLLPEARDGVARGNGIGLPAAGRTVAVERIVDGTATRTESGNAQSFKPDTGCPAWSPPV